MTTNIIFPAPGAPNSYQLNYEFFSCDVSTNGSLSIYNASPLETDLPIYINSQYNVAYDVTNWYLNSITNILTSTVRTPFITQTIYFNNTTQNGIIRYRKNTDIKLTYLETGVSKIVTIKDSNQISITFDIYDGFPIVNTSGLRLVNITSDIFPSNIRLPSSPTNFPAPGALSATRWEYKFNTTDCPNTSSLSHFDYTDYETDTPVYVNSQYNVTYDVANWYIKESDILTSSTKSVSDTQTLYFNNILNDSLKFLPSHTIKISYSITGFSAKVQVLAATTISITFPVVNDFPIVNQGSLRIVRVTMDVYPKLLTQIETYSKGTKLSISNSARENLAVSESLPNYRGISYFETKGLSSFSLSPVINSLTPYTSQSITGDKTFALTGQSINVDTIDPSTVVWYINDNDILTYSIVNRTVKTVYFTNQLSIPFVTGSTVRIRNSLVNYSKTFTVVVGTTNSVVLDINDEFPTNGTYIDDFTSSVYRQVDVRTYLPPINARENLFYAVLTPGKYSAWHEKLASDSISFNTPLLTKSPIKVKSDNIILNLFKETKLKSTATHVLSTPSLSLLPKPITKLLDNTPRNFVGFTNKPVITIKSVKTPDISSIISKFTVSSQYIQDISQPLVLTQLSKVTRTLKSDTIALSVDRLKTFSVNSSKTMMIESPLTSAVSIKFKVQSNIINSNVSNIENYYKQSLVVTNLAPTNPRENLFYSLMLSSKYSAAKYYTVSETPQILSLGSPSSTPSSVIQIKWRDFISVSNNLTPYGLSNFNIPENNTILVTGQSNVYDVVSWYIYENQIIQSTTPTIGSIQTLYFNNSALNALFYVNNYITISQSDTGFNATVQIVSTTYNSVSFAKIVGFPLSIANMTITGASNPVYSKSLVSSQLLPNGIIRETTLPRENLFAAENLPNLRGQRYGQYFNLTSFGNNTLSHRLEVFQDSKLIGDDRLQVISQSSDLVTASTNIVQWYSYDTDIITTSTSPAATKTLYFNNQLFVPFASGKIVRLISNVTSTLVTVILGTTNSISFIQPTTPIGIDNLYIENITSTVYQQLKVSTTIPAITPRERLYYSLIRPSSKTNITFDTVDTLKTGSLIKSAITLKGEPSNLKTGSSRISVKVSADTSQIAVSSTKILIKVSATEKTLNTTGNLRKSISQLTSTGFSYQTPTATTTYTSTVFWSSTPIPVSGINGFSTVPPVPVWYEYDADVIKSVSTPTAYVTLYTGLLISNGGDRIRLLQPNVGFNRIFSVVSSTSTSITILDPGDLPNISGMYFLWGRPGVTPSVTFTNSNAVPLVTFKQFQNQMFEVPAITVISKPITKLTNDNTTYNSGNIQKQLVKLTSVAINPKPTTTLVSITPTITWYNEPIYVTGITGVTTNPIVANWYTFDEKYNIITQTTSNTATITLYISTNQIGKNIGDRIRLLQPNTGFNRIFLIISSTIDSVTIQNPGDLPNISGMYFLWGAKGATSTVSSTSDDSVSNILKFKPQVVFFDAPQVSALKKQLTSVAADRTKLETSSTKIQYKVIAEQSNITVNSTKIPFKVVSVEKQYPSVSISSTVVSTTIKWSNDIIPITGVNITINTPTIAKWYTFDELYNTFASSISTPSNITLYFGPTLYPVFGTKIRILQPNVGYDKTFTIIAYTNSSVTIVNPGDLPNISSMYSIWGITSNTTAVSFNDNNQLAIINKAKIVKIADTSYTPNVSKVTNVPNLRGDSIVHAIKPRLETYNNLGFTYGSTVTATQSYDNTIPITGITSSTNNVSSWYTYDLDILLVPAIAAPSVITLFFGPTTYTIGSTVTLIDYVTRYYSVVPVLSSTINSININNPYDLPNTSNLHIYINTTLVFPMYANNGFSNYAKITSSNLGYSVILPIVYKSGNSITVVKSSYYDMTISATSYVTIEDASPSVYPFWQSSTIANAAHDRYLTTLRINPSPYYNRPIQLSLNTPQSAQPVIGKLSPSLKVTSIQTYISTSVSTTIVNPSISWSSEQLPVVGRSGVSTIPSIAKWYTFDELNNSFTVYDNMSATLTLYFTSAYTSAINFTRVKIIHPTESYNKIFTILSATANSVTISMPTYFPTISNMYMYLGVTCVNELISYSDSNGVPIVKKSPSVLVKSVIMPEMAKLSPSFVVRGDLINIGKEHPVVNKAKPAISGIFETPKVISTALKYIVKPVVTDFTPSRVKAVTVLKGEPSVLDTKRLEIFTNVKGVIENLTTIASWYDTAILISGRKSKYTANVIPWYINESDILSLTVASLPSDITLSFVNLTGITIGSTVTLIQYETGYFNTVSVLSSTNDSITIANTNLPDSGLYIYFGTTVTFAAQSPYAYTIGSNASILIPGTVPTTITVTNSSATTVSFVRTSTFNIISGISTLYNSNPSYYPQSLVFNPNRPPVNARENLFYGLISPTLRYATPFTAKSATELKTNIGRVNTPLFVVKGEGAYRTNEVTSTTSSTYIKWSDSIIISGTNLNTANTSSWYINDYDKLTTTVYSRSNITLYFNPMVLPTIPDNKLTVRILQDNSNYYQLVTVVSRTNDSITIVNPGNLPNISSMRMQWGYPAITSTYTFSNTANNVSSLSIFKSTNYSQIVNVDPAGNLKQLFNVKSDNTTISSSKINTISIRNMISLDIPKISSTYIKFKLNDITPTKLDFSGILPRVVNQNGIYSLSDYFINQATVLPTTAPSLPREYLYYSILAKGKYGISTDNRTLVSVKILENIGYNDINSYIANPDLYLKFFPNGIVNLSKGVRYPTPVESLGDVPKLPLTSLLTNYFNVPTNISAKVYNQSKYDILKWYTYDQYDIIASVINPDGLTQTLYFVNTTFGKLFNTTDVVKISQTSSNFNITLTVLDSTYTSITVNKINGYPLGEITISNLTSPIYPRDFTSTQMLPKGIVRETTLPRENLFAAENLPNLRGVSYFVVNPLGGLELPKTNRLETFNNTLTPGDFKLQVRLQSSDITSATDTALWYINDQDLIPNNTVISTTKTLYFDNQDIAPFSIGSTIKLTSPSIVGNKIFTVLACTPNSVVIRQPSELFLNDNLFVERTVASVYQQSAVSTIGPASNARENLYYSLIRPLSKSLYSIALYNETSLVTSLLKNAVPKLASDLNTYDVNSTQIKIKINAEPNTLNTGKVVTPVIVRDVQRYPSVEVASRTTTTSFKWETVPIFVTGISGRSTIPTIPNWYTFDDKINTLSIIDTNANYITLYTADTTIQSYGNFIRLIHPAAGYDRIFDVVSSTTSSVTITNPRDLPNISGMYFMWGRNISSTTITFTNNNATPLINIVKSINAYVFEISNQISILSKQLVKLKGDPNTLTPASGIVISKLIADRSFLNTTKTPVVPAVTKGYNLKFNDTTQIMINSRGQVSKFITSNYESIMSAEPIQKKETIQFWN